MSLPTNKPFLVNYPNTWYVETGVWRGDSIQLALDAGFSKILGIDVDPASVDFCRDRFDFKNRIHGDRIDLRCGDSAQHLGWLLESVTEPATILLDAHWQLLEGTERGKHPFPLLEEIAQIACHPIKTHTIIVDDLLYMTHPMVTGWNYTDILGALAQVNSAYRFELLANPVVNNLLVAHL